MTRLEAQLPVLLSSKAKYTYICHIFFTLDIFLINYFKGKPHTISSLIKLEFVVWKILIRNIGYMCSHMFIYVDYTLLLMIDKCILFIFKTSPLIFIVYIIVNTVSVSSYQYM